MAVLLLLPTVHNMYEVSYIHAADGPHEMMVYVQTTTDVNIVMAKVDALDQKMYGGKHLLPIGLMNDATWPFAWYVRDYTNVCFNYPDGCAATAKTYPVIITGGDNLYTAESPYAGNKGSYMFHQYHMRTWWDEGYKPPPCVPSRTNNCADQPTYGGVGVGLWLSYGDTPPPNAKFNLGLAVQQHALKNLITDRYSTWAELTVEPSEPLEAPRQFFNLQYSWSKGLAATHKRRCCTGVEVILCRLRKNGGAIGGD